MIFSSVTYVMFFAVVLLVLGVLRARRLKMLLLLCASYVFYAWWDWRFTFLLAGITLVNYSGALWINGTQDSRKRKRSLVCVVAADLGILGIFKYLGFFIDSANGLLEQLGVRIPMVSLVLPVAISFVTFEVISYVTDVYRRDLEPASIQDVALLVAFFPHLIAGPILKPRLFLPQLKRDIVVSRSNLSLGAQQFALGLAKKVLIADRLATVVDSVFVRPGAFNRATLWVAALAYAVQIYADFSGYSDMAIGSARCIGLDIPPNFNAPYAARNITEFWRRWHVSLSTWLREYLYIPLGGNRKGKTRQAINLMIVMLLAGLWHGASWNFVVWGGIHGAALVAHKIWVDRISPLWAAREGSLAAFALGASSRLATWVFVGLAWVFFRVTDVSKAAVIAGRMVGFGDPSGVAWYAVWALLLVPVAFAADLAVRRTGPFVPRLRLVSFWGGFAVTSLAIALLLFWPAQSSPFIYFQF